MAIQYIKGSFIQRVKEVITSHLKDEGFGVSELAGEMHMSRSTLHRRIKGEAGISVSQYIRNARLNKAQDLLIKDTLSVAEAAYLTGFRSASYFSKCYRNHFGYPPVETLKRAFDDSDIKTRNVDEGRDGSGMLLNNFPAQTTSFIGRQKEIGTIIDLIEKYRIVTLSGTGGCGKTRLVFEVAPHLTKAQLII